MNSNDKLAEVVELIALQWDGCRYASPGESIDIGAAIRRTWERVAATILHPPVEGEWVMVPREPTEAMIEAICTEHGSGGWPQGYGRQAQRFRREQAVEGYRAMIAAAPASHSREDSLDA